MTTKKILENARALISKPDRWYSGTLASNGKFCAIGAIAHVTTGQYEYDIPEHQPAVRALAGVLRPEGFDSGMAEEIVYTYNDVSGHECVLAAFDAAIERA